MVMPEECQFFFKRSARVNHSREPPALQFTAIKFREVIRVREIEAALNQTIERGIINLLVIDEEINRALAPASCKSVNLFRAAAESHPSEQMSGGVKG